jgi:hypothetical protein
MQTYHGAPANEKTIEFATKCRIDKQNASKEEYLQCFTNLITKSTKPRIELVETCMYLRPISAT